MSQFAEGAGVDSSAVRSHPVAICISASSDFSFAAAVTFINFIKIHGVKGFHFRLFSDSKLPKFETIFRNIGADIKVELYRPPVSWSKLWGSRAIAYFSPLVLAKFEGFRLLSSFPTVVWLDYDIVITNSLSELWTRDDFDLAYQGSSQPVSKAFMFPVADILEDGDGFHAATIVFRESFPDFGGAIVKLYGLFEKHSSNLYYPEQGIFDLFLQSIPRFRRWELGGTYGQFPDAEEESTAILHTPGANKFWNGLQNDSWSSHYKEWLDLGGWGWNPLSTKLRKLMRGLKYAGAVLVSVPDSIFSPKKIR
jgi:lipopolysaccharide biosynthesis glycosyltransferase